MACASVASAQQSAPNCNSTVQKDTSCISKKSLFDKKAEKALLAMHKTAKELKIEGVSVVCFFSKDQKRWSSKMEIVGTIADANSNFLAIAYAKAAEMARTLKPSGTSGRPVVKFVGETGWQGGVIKEIAGGYLLTAFSGGPSAKDLLVAEAGVVAYLK